MSKRLEAIRKRHEEYGKIATKLRKQIEMFRNKGSCSIHGNHDGKECGMCQLGRKLNVMTKQQMANRITELKAENTRLLERLSAAQAQLDENNEVFERIGENVYIGHLSALRVCVQENKELQAQLEDTINTSMTKIDNLKAQLDAVNKNCIKSEKGTGYCNYCAKNQPELCRYVNTIGAIDHIEQLQAQLDAVKWQPIETAPKQGAILLWVPENKCTYCAIWSKNGCGYTGWVIFGGEWREHLQRATHWMPLPQALEQEQS